MGVNQVNTSELGIDNSVIYALNRAYMRLNMRKRTMLVGQSDFEGNAVLDAMETIEDTMRMIYDARR